MVNTLEFISLILVVLGFLSGITWMILASILSPKKLYRKYKKMAKLANLGVTLVVSSVLILILSKIIEAYIKNNH